MYRNLRGEMVKAGISVAELAKKIGISEKSMRNKINGDTEFTLSEAIKVRMYVAPGAEMEELFVLE